MKNSLCIFLLFSIFIIPIDAHAHPGRTDGSGGHTCRTNCGDWGLDYGEYHYHSDTSSSSSSSSSSNNNTYNYYESEEYRTTQYDNGYSSGFYDGESGYKHGKTLDYYVSSDYLSSYSEYYKNGYRDGFIEGYNLAEQKDYYYTLGEEKGYNQLDLSSSLNDIPKDFQEVFSNGFQSGSSRKNSELKHLAEEQGYKDGLNLAEKKSTYSEYILKNAYETEYSRGLQEKLDSIEEEGFNSAYVNNQLVIPKEYESIKQAATHFAQGFENNSEASEIKKEAYDDGFWFIANNKDNILPQYENAKEIYELHYEKGKKEALQLYKNLAIGCSFVFVLSTGALLYLKRRTKKSV